MSQKFVGVCLLIFGIYLLLVNPIASVLIHVVFNLRLAISFPYYSLWIVVLGPMWWWITILFAGLGVVFIKYGRRNVLYSREALKVQV